MNHRRASFRLRIGVLAAAALLAPAIEAVLCLIENKPEHRLCAIQVHRMRKFFRKDVLDAQIESKLDNGPVRKRGGREL